MREDARGRRTIRVEGTPRVEGTNRVAGMPRVEGGGQTLSRALRPRGPVRLALSKRVVRGATMLEVGGELDVLTAAKLGPELDDVIRKQIGDVIVDLRSTGFIDSAGLQLLLSAQRRLSRRERGLVVVCGPGQVRRVIERARLLGALGAVSNLGELQGAASDFSDCDRLNHAS
jgi:anti-sigma B factor antagonist